MKINPLIEKSVAAVLYDFEFWDGLLLIWKFLPSNRRYIKFIPYTFGSQHYHFIMNSSLWRHFCIMLTCPPKISPVLMLDWRLRKGGYFIGQKTIQAGTNH